MSTQEGADDAAAGGERKRSGKFGIVVLAMSVLAGACAGGYGVSRLLPLIRTPQSDSGSLPRYAVPAPAVPNDQLERALQSMRSERESAPATDGPTTQPATTPNAGSEVPATHPATPPSGTSAN